jgi:hypothetical protein
VVKPLIIKDSSFISKRSNDLRINISKSSKITWMQGNLFMHDFKYDSTNISEDITKKKQQLFSALFCDLYLIKDITLLPENSTY